ncbi:MAG: hypothetical protein ABFC89_04870 [Methanospirillum sp.]
MNGEDCVAKAKLVFEVLRGKAEIADHVDGKVAGVGVRNRAVDQAVKNPVCNRLAVRSASERRYLRRSTS